ncbi:MAG: hypothetical protein BWZ01_02926 [Deltaproteobacteria bacterium ADurb.BinA179]|nr:MAG: hypothetical protein BWZ01_02926 [Deltaproteobacteria bacterium ADurb.BinA179]
MVKGLDVFRERFSEYSDRYVLIGGTACDIALGAAGIAYRGTKDLDIVLCIEALEREFCEELLMFIKDAGYIHQEKSTGKEIFYRFFEPTDDSFPFMLELFSRKPDVIVLAEGSHLTPIPADAPGISLSAILLDDECYELIQSMKVEVDGLSVAGADLLIPLKAVAWVRQTKRRDSGEDVHENDIRKHRNDVFRLYQVISPGDRVVIPGSLKEEMRSFIEAAESDGSIDLKSLGIRGTSVSEVCSRLREVYGID